MNGAHHLKKFDNELQIVWGEVYVPGFPDSQGEFMTTDEVRKMAHRFAMHERLGSVDVMHDNKTYKAHVVESFIARKGDPDFIEGSWVAAVYVEDEDLWGRVKKGELNGFSLEGLALKEEEESEMEIDTPAFVMLDSMEADGHKHVVKVFIDDEGNITGGETDFVDGHRHLIKRGTITEEASGHAHKFALLDAILAAA